MTRRIVILGAGTGGTLAANRLRRLHSRDAVEITVVDQDDDHVYQPGLLFVPFGLKGAQDLRRSRREQLHAGIGYYQSAIDRVEIADDRVVLSDGTNLSYDVLIVATGAILVPEETEGLSGPGWNDTVCTFYSPAGAEALRQKL